MHHQGQYQHQLWRADLPRPRAALLYGYPHPPRIWRALVLFGSGRAGGGMAAIGNLRSFTAAMECPASDTTSDAAVQFDLIDLVLNVSTLSHLGNDTACLGNSTHSFAMLWLLPWWPEQQRIWAGSGS